MVKKPPKGQVFLADNEVLRRIAEAAALRPEEDVLEIGMGRGQLTQHLVRLAREVVAVELEERFVDGAAEDFARFDNLTIVHANILDVSWDEVVPAGRRVVVVGNIPFYITGPILRLLAEHRADIVRWSLLMQREVAERICASPGDPAYGGLSVKMQFWGEPYYALTVPAAAFRPVPAVDAAVVNYVFRDAPAVDVPSPEYFDHFVDFLFAGRRKKLGNRAVTLLGGALGAAEVAAKLRGAGFDPDARPERFSPEEFGGIYRTLRPYLDLPT
ncbi:MAG: 16S rRNA (adenine(1518)-N(6)/adenine(1519)-N(6))-dimethyltransferase RsmA [Candidatus Zixiibacteriota bacterium]